MAQETVAIAWCDNGMVDGKFMQGVTDVMLKSGINFTTTLRSQGNQIARQREKIIRYWYENDTSEWLLWVDSDVVITPDKFKLLWDNKDAVVPHMKRFSFDEHYYKAFFGGAKPKTESNLVLPKRYKKG